uniref:Hemagglutinin n=1 Tax=Prevotella sp. GTC17262 TaxID=3236797 RepID=A0AB33JM27_9BACT
MEIKKIYHHALQHMEHFQFASHVLAMCKEANIEKLNLVLPPLTAAIAAEDKALNLPRQEEGTKELEALDTARDHAYRALQLLVELHLHSDDSAVRTAAERVAEVLSRYPKATQANYDKESGMLKNLIADLLAPSMNAHEAKLGAAPYILRLDAANTAFDNRYRSRLKSAVPTGTHDIKQLRADTDKALAAVTLRMQSLDDLEPSATVSALIIQYNALVEKRRATIAHRAATNKAARERKESGADKSHNPHAEELARLKTMIAEYEQSSHFTPGIVQSTGLAAGKDATRAYQVYLSDQPTDLFWLTVKDGKLKEIEFQIQPGQPGGLAVEKLDK